MVRLGLSFLSRGKRPTASDGTPIHKVSLVEYYAAYLFGKHPLKVSRGEVEIARRELIRLALESLALNPTRQDSVNWIVSRLGEFYSVFPRAPKKWKTFARLLSGVSVDDVLGLDADVREKLHRAYRRRGRKFPSGLRRVLEELWGEPSSRGSHVVWWELYAKAVLGVDDVREVPQEQLDVLRREFYGKVALCWFKSSKRRVREACLKRELKVIFERFSGLEFKYSTFWAMVRRMSAEEIAEYVPADVLRGFLRKTRSSSGDFLSKVHRAMILASRKSRLV